MSKAAPEPLKLQLAALDSEARALVDFVVWNLCAVEKISKKRDKLFPEVLSQRRSDGVFVRPRRLDAVDAAVRE